jgi:hypothetical protein
MSLKSVRDLDTIPRLCAAIDRRGRIGADDVANLDRNAPRGLRLTHGEAAALFALARQNHPACAEWGDYCADALGVWFVDFAGEMAPPEAACLLMEWLGGAEARLDPARFRMLARVLERLPDCPEDLLAFARACLVRAMAPDGRARSAGAA